MFTRPTKLSSALAIGAVIGTLLCLAPQADARERILLSRYTGNWDGRETTLYVAQTDGSGERQLLSVPGYDYGASFSRDARWVVFTSERAGSPDIYRVRTDGSGMERLTDDPALDDQAALSPDGRRLAFVSTRAKGTADIWVMDIATRRLRNLTGGAGGNFRPSWSPDGKFLAFSSDRNTVSLARPGRFERVQNLSLYVMGSDGRDVRRLTAPGLYAGSPKWSEDGRKIVFYQTTGNEAFDTAVMRGTFPRDRQADPNQFIPLIQGGGAPTADVVSQIATIEVATGALVQLTSGAGFKVAPQFLGDDVAYVVKSGPTMGVHFTKGRTGVPGQVRDPAWAPSGAQMVYQKLRSWPLVQNQPLDGKLPQQFELVWSHPFPAFSSSGKLAVTTDFARGSGISILRSDGSVERLLSDPNATGEALSPTWSRDEQWIAYGQGGFFRGAAAQARIIMARTDGSGERKVLETGAGNAGFPSFSPDGQRLVFRYRGATEQGLRTLSLIDGRLQTLTAERDDIPAWSPDGERIAFTRAIGDGFDIFTIRPDGSGLQRLTNSPGLNAHATWSPDGRHLLFASGRLGFKDEQALYYDWTTQAYTELFVMDVDGGNQRALTDNKWEDGTATWAPAP